jgi:peptide deformylase
VERHVQITIKGQNRRGQNVKYKAQGWLARIFQHEIDHLNGVLFTDLATKVWKPTPEEADLIKD